jgi:hypothetical protein
MKRNLAINAALSVSLLCLVSCGKKVSIPGGSVEQSGDQIRINNGGGTFVAGGDVKLPDGFPDNIPQPSKVLSVAMVTPQGMTVAFKCKGTQSDEYEKLKAAFQTQGWEETMAMQSANGSVIGVKKGENRHIQDSVGKDNNGTLINLIITQR